MTPETILAELASRGIRLRRDGDSLLVSPRDALTDDLRMLIRQHRDELLEVVPQALEIHAGCYACDGCRNIRMVEEQRGSNPRRVFWFKCGKGHRPIEAAYFGERVLLAPASCNDYTLSTTQ